MSDDKLDAVRRMTRRRLWFAAVHLLLYFSFTLNWTRLGEPLRRTLGDSMVTGSVLMFVLLIPLFIAMEFLFLALEKRGARK